MIHAGRTLLEILKKRSSLLFVRRRGADRHFRIMTREKLKNYRHLIKEIEKLNKDIDRLLKRQAKIPDVKDKVQKSMDEYPYTLTHITVDAKDPLTNDTIERLLLKKRARLLRIQNQRLAIEDFIASIEDSRARQIIEAVYVDGKSHQQVADKMFLSKARISQIIAEYVKD